MKQNVHFRIGLLGGLSLILALAVSACPRPDMEGGPPGLGLPPFGPPPGPPLDVALRDALMRAGTHAVDVPTRESEAMVNLGRALFFDKILSGDKNISCATCHHPTAGTGDGLSTSIGAGGSGATSGRTLGTGATIGRNAPPLFHLATTSGALFWDGRVSKNTDNGTLSTPEDALNGTTPTRADIVAQLTSALAAQAMFPVTSDAEMRGAAGNEIRDAATNEDVWAALMARLVGTSNGTVGGIADYRGLFSAAFPDVSNYDDFNFGHAARAIAAFEVSAFSLSSTSTRSAFDRYIFGDEEALSLQEKQGALIFFGRRGGCARCHSGPLLSDFQFHAAAFPQVGPGQGGESSEDRGRALASSDTSENYRFRTPPLRNVELSGPWSHSGAYTSLEGVVRHYSDVSTSLFSYDPSQLRADYQSTHDSDSTRNNARLAALDNRLQRDLNLDDNEVNAVVAFLKTLTDPGMRDLSSVIPTSVPSGLSVSD